MIGTIMDRKLICGIWHRRAPCGVCGEMMWVSESAWLNGMLLHVECDNCYKEPAPGVGNPHPDRPRSEIQYNGADPDAA